MAKTKTQFVCQQCGAKSVKWIGRCPSCNGWNTYVEEIISESSSKHNSLVLSSVNQPVALKDIDLTPENRLDTGITELNRVLGGGIVPGSVILIGGEPGIGKSTLVLQLTTTMKNTKVLYITGEESKAQIKMRAARLGYVGDNCFILCETMLENIISHIENHKRDLIVIDSIQTLQSEYIESSPGSISQVRESATRLQRYAKETSVPVIIISHITKEGSIAGPKALEHIVDTVLQFEGDQHYFFRILRTTKNRFGSTSELGIFEMKQNGLNEVLNPSEALITQHDEKLSGTAIASTIDGIRPLLIEVQALASSSVYGVPQRSATGFDLRRLNMLLAVLEKRAGFKLAAKDIFLNIAGGIKVSDPAIDLAVVAAILSSSVNIPIDHNICFTGEIGLTGEIRPVNRIEQRISEAEKLGFSELFISSYNKKNILNAKIKISINYISKVDDLVKHLFK